MEKIDGEKKANKKGRQYHIILYIIKHCWLNNKRRYIINCICMHSNLENYFNETRMVLERVEKMERVLKYKL